MGPELLMKIGTYFLGLLLSLMALYLFISVILTCCKALNGASSCSLLQFASTVLTTYS